MRTANQLRYSIYLLLFTPCIVLAQEVPSLFVLAKQTVAKNPQLPLDNLNQPCKKAVIAQRAKLKLWAAFKKGLKGSEMQSRWFLMPQYRKLSSTEIRQKARFDLLLAYRKKKLDKQTGFDILDSSGHRRFQTTLADGRQMRLIEVTSADFDEFVQSLPDSEKSLAQSAKSAYYSSPHPMFSGYMYIERDSSFKTSYPISQNVDFEQHMQRINDIDLLKHKAKHSNETIVDNNVLACWGEPQSIN